MTVTILVVDDDPIIRRMFRKQLERNYRIFDCDRGLDAIELVRQHAPQIVLLDLSMPGLDGFETCRRLKTSSASPPLISIVSAHSASAEMMRAFEAGADDYLVKPVDHCELQSRVRLLVRLRHAIDSNTTGRLDARDPNEDVTAVQFVTAFVLAKLAETRDNETGAHLARIRDYTLILAERLQETSPYAEVIDVTFLTDLYRSSPLHDIGKVGISDSILQKPGPLTPEEYETMKQHTVIGANILDAAVQQLPAGGFLSMAATVARYHHERWDGTGYPSGLAGENIPLSARIVALADVYDALTTERPYKNAWSPERARQQIISGSGNHFDPRIVDAFERAYEDFLDTQLVCPTEMSSSMSLVPRFHLRRNVPL